MNILYVTTISNTMNAFLMPHIKMLLDEGHHVSIACSIQQPLDEFFENNNIPFYNIPFDRTPFSKNNRTAYKVFKSLVDVKYFDIVHTHTPIASMIVRLACKNSKSKVFYTAHGFHFYKGAPIKNWLVYYPVEKYLSKYTDELITINQEDYNTAKNKFLKTNVNYVHGVGLSTEKFNKEKPSDLSKYKKNDDSFIFLSIGELNDNKNHEQVINELEKIRHMNFIYIICGVGEKEKYLERIIVEKNLKDKVFLLGYREDIPSILAASDIYIHPSKREGLPVSIMEAMYQNLPVFCSNIRGNSDLIQHENNGYLVDLGNIKQNFSYYISKIFNDANFIRKMGENNKGLIEPYLIENVLKELKIIYQKIV
ncbi:hypothetical protein IGI78_002096 [Enterococcus sp. DIV1767]|uniref:glycosyltransferase family 4 protein n=1 Tax=Enterococcus sp. DIV1767 TaxID=2774670 RepID=UPI00189A1A5F